MTASNERKFILEIKLDEDGMPLTSTRNQGLPYEIIVGAISHQLHLYNSMWAKKSSTTIEDKG
ncbi:MAG: hypothetical protein ABH834_08210 [Candidatus Altiarchaeota archaeon]